MDNNKIRFLLPVALLFVISGGLLWWHAPVSITDIEPEAVSQIEIFNGNTGQKVAVTNPGEINHISSGIQGKIFIYHL